MSAALVGELAPRERLEAESHAARCAACADAVRELGEAAVALDRAYAPLRGYGVPISAARVHLALRVPARPSRIVRYTRLAAKANELAVAAAVMVFAILGSLPAPEAVSWTEPVPSLRLRNAWAELARSEPYLAQRIGRYLLHDTLLDARVVPLNDPRALAPEQVTPGAPF